MPAVSSSPIPALAQNVGPVGLDSATLTSLADAFAVVPDPRSMQGRRHPLTEILLIAACVVTCDADGLTAVWQWAVDAPQEVLARLGARVDPLSGLRMAPSERTIRRTVARVDPQAVQDAAGTFVAVRLCAAGLGETSAPSEREARRVARASRARTRPPGRGTWRRFAFDGKVLRGARRRSGGRVTLLAGVCHDTGAVVGHAPSTRRPMRSPHYGPSSPAWT